jgi:hypothetical protein
MGLTQPPIQWVPGALSLGLKRKEREAHHSPPCSAEVKECVELYLHSPIRLHGVVLVKMKAQGQLYFTLLYFTLLSCLPTSSYLWLDEIQKYVIPSAYKLQYSNRLRYRKFIGSVFTEHLLPHLLQVIFANVETEPQNL